MPAITLTNSTNVRSNILVALQRVELALATTLAPERAVEIAARLFSTPPRFAHTSRELELLATGTRYTVDTNDGALAAWRFGEREREAVLLVHGWGGRGAQLGAFVPALLEAGYQVILFDHVSHGSSEGKRATLVHFWNGLAAVIADAERAGTRIAGMIGHSLGAAAVGAWLNETRRELRAVLVAPPTSVERHSGYFARRAGIPETVRRAMQEHFERTLGRRWADFELPDAVAHVRAPMLVVHDRGDAEVSFGSGLALARAWKGARLRATEGLGHNRILRDPEVVQDAVDFISRRVVFAPPPAKGERAPFNSPAPIA
jgi:pimeloyl-ACP methyl ester carboxylesterase